MSQMRSKEFLVVSVWMLTFVGEIGRSLSSRSAKAHLNMRVAGPVCEQTAKFVQTKEIQKPITEAPLNQKTEACASVKWTECAQGDAQCNKFKVAKCGKEEAKKGTEDGKKSGGASTKIFGGDDAKKHEFPHQVRLVDLRYHGTFCSGTIINETFVITAAHCVGAVPPEFILLLAGDHNVDIQDHTEQIRTVAGIFLYSAFNCFQREGDIALIKLNQSFVMSEHVKFAQFATGLPIHRTGQDALPGWGLQSDDCAATALKKVLLRFVRREDCEILYERDAQEKITVKEDEACLQFPPNIHDAPEDLGGGIVRNNTANGDWVLLAVLSTHTKVHRSFGLPRVFTTTLRYIPFINDVLDGKVTPHQFRRNALPTRGSGEEYDGSKMTPTGSPTTRMIGGTDAVQDEFPFNVRLLTEADAVTFCGGAILSPWLVITAADCVQNKTPDEVLVFAGEINTMMTEPTEQQRQATDFFTHKCYTISGRHEANVAILKVDKPFVFGKSVQAVELSNMADATGAPLPKILGWGEVTGGCRPVVLQKASVTISPGAICEQHASRNNSYKMSPRMLCTSPTAEQMTGPCDGDLGAPLVYQRLDGNPNEFGAFPYVLLGLASDSLNCAAHDKKQPTIYTNVFEFRAWIHSFLAFNFAGPTSRVAQAEVTLENEIRYQVRLFHSVWQSFFCSGALVSLDFVLTTTSCVVGLKAHEIRVVAGEDDVSKYGGMEQERGVKRVAQHPGYNPNTFLNDIAFLRLDRPFLMTARVSTLELPLEGTENMTEFMATATGWGERGAGKCRSSRLLKSEVFVLSKVTCDKEIRDGHGRNPAPTIFCAGNETSHGHCEGDHGAPLVENSIDGISSYLLGLASFGFTCDFATMYTRVVLFLDWIREESLNIVDFQ